jgi:2-polyprenyl-3-methyl-5-hydroxy-6-metoxy-1,4-benzoquinol methylase
LEIFPASNRSGAKRVELLNRIDSHRVFTQDYNLFGYDYFDNSELGIGYGGYVYDGRFAGPIKKMVDHYGLKPGDKVLEIGCAKGYLLVEFQKLGMQVKGLDISQYAVKNAHPDVAKNIELRDASQIFFEDKTFDLVLGKEVLPHLEESKVRSTILESMRVSKGNIFFDIQCGRTAKELELLKKWDSTHRTLKTSEQWDEFFASIHYQGDYYYRFLFPENI